MGVVLSNDVIVSAAYRLLVLLIVAGGAARMHKRHHWPVWGLCLFGLCSNVAYITGSLSLSGLFGVPYVGMVGWVAIDYMRSDTTALRALLAARQAEWSKERHDLANDLAAREAELYVFRDRASDRDDKADARDERQDRRGYRQEHREILLDARDDLGAASGDE